MSDNSNTPSSGAKSDLNRRKEEASIFNSFVSIIQDAFVTTSTDQSHVDRLDKLYQQPEYSAEKARLTKMNNNGMIAGIAAGVGSFIFLRRGPRVLSRYLMRRAEARGGSGGGGNPANNNGGGGSGGYQFDRRNPFENAKQMSQPMNAMGEGAASSQLPPPPPPPPRQPGIFIRTFKFGLDVFVSGMMALYMSAIWTDKKRLLHEAAEMPLVEGRSLISDELCADFRKHYATIPQDTWAKHRGTSDALTAIETFVVNCQRRQLFERALRHERGLQPGGSAQDYHPTIPSPGVPKDLDVVLADIGRDGDGSEGSDKDGVYQEDSFQQDFFDDGFSDEQDTDQWEASDFDGKKDDEVDNEL
eukprot:CAMPEP_0181065102 /NCGR_PEP_ID=MMETSP1070-20121207/24557_1 /TAXON_ID=265543 /ORGANISM="Minutocellus polymorphus, Strain NH13" /LENGTH=358 /DNA_ID=CAMNT_0023145465 /DNA_START=69 /DNA_END=1146 /DNA_ORIENTATION=+